MDDFEFAYNNEEEKSKFYQELNKKLSSLNLKIKVKKNKDDTFPFKKQDDSVFYFGYFKNQKKSRKDIHFYIDQSIYNEAEGQKGALKLMFGGLRNALNEKELLVSGLTMPMMKKLFNLVLMKPDLMVYFLEFSEELNKDKLQLFKASITEMSPVIIDIAKRYIDLEYHQELFSILSVFYYFNLSDIFPKELLYEIIIKMDDISAILAFEIILLGEAPVEEELMDKIDVKLANSPNWHDEFWLFKYHTLYRVNVDRKSELKKVYKNYLFNNYNENNTERSKFFNKKQLRKLKTNFIIERQNKQSDQDISALFNQMFELGINFLGEPLIH